jgi:hypothetical protein
MATRTQTPSPQAQRESLRRSERQAAERQPENFKDAETDDKVVEIGPDLQNAPIEGLDPASDRSRERGRTASDSSAGEEDPDAGLDDPDMRDAIQGEAEHARTPRR